jgi:hypothetical protein
MAVGRRIPVGGSIRSLSPTEGKFRVKGLWRDRQLAAYFWTGMGLNAMKPGLSGG